ncbi:MAG: hypothetical protein WC655_05785 [Candidatus Hydrogenedentales bacterium]|jgi:hypothetical protein
MQGSPAFHGTPHEVERFSTEKIGTGEGSQVYGWGLYFAENPEVANDYQRRLTDSEHRRIRGRAAAEAIAGEQGRSNTVEWQGRILPFHEFAQQYRDGEISDATLPPHILQKLPPPSGATYTVDLKVTPDELLDWDKPLREQSDKVKRAVRQAFQTINLPEGGEPFFNRANGESAYASIASAGFTPPADSGWTSIANIQWRNGRIVGNEQTASLLLSKAGIKGIRYLDQGSRPARRAEDIATTGASVREYLRKIAPQAPWSESDNISKFGSWPSTASLINAIRDFGRKYSVADEVETLIQKNPQPERPTYNYVIFDEKDIEITHKNGAPVPKEQASLELQRAFAQPAVQGRAPVEAKSVEDLLSLLDAGKTGLSPKQAEFLRALLDNPKLAAALDGIRFHVTDALSNGWNGSFFDGLVTIVSDKDPVIAIEEVLHAVMLALPKEMQAELERLRVQSINNVLEEIKAGENPDPIKIAALESLRDKPTAGANDFLSRNFPESFRNEIYPYSNWQEYGSQTASKRFEKKAGSTVEGFWQQLKDIIRGFIRALRGLFRNNGKEQDIFDDVLSGNFELAPKERQQAQEAQASLGEAKAETPPAPAAAPEFDVADWQAEMQRELGEEEGVVTRVMGREDTVENRARLNRANGTLYAKQLFQEVGLTVTEAPGGFWKLADEAIPQEAEGRQLLARLNELKKDPESPVFQSPMGGGGSLLNSVRVYLTADSVTAFSKDLKRQLYKAAQEEASHRGLMLAALRGGKQSVEYVARHVDVVLSEQYRKEHGDPAIDTVVKGALEDFKAWFTDEELENALKSAPGFADLLKRLTGDKAIEFLRRVFELPFSQRADLRKNAEQLAVETLNVSPEQARTLGKAFENAFDTMFDRATTHALTVIERMLSGRERQRLGVGRRRGAWQAIVSAVKAGTFDADYIIARIAQSLGGYTIPTEAEIATVRELAERLDKLRTPPAALLKEAKTDSERARKRREFRDSTSERQVEIQRRIGTHWAKWTKPFALRNKQGRRNIIEAMYEFTAGNLLAKAGFITRQSLDVGTYAIIHIPFRAMANVMVQHGGFVRGATTAEFWKDFDNILRESVEGQVKSLKAGAREFREALRGTAEIKNVDRLLSGIALFERVQLKADELAQKGRHVEAFMLRLLGAMRFGYRFASGWDNLQGTGQEWQEMRTQAYRGFRDQGMNPAEAKLATERLMPDQKAATLKAVDQARRNYEMAEPGVVPKHSEIMSGAYHMLKGMFYEGMRAAGMPADELEAKIRLMRSANAWNESMTGVVSPGGLMSSLMKGFGELGKNVPVIGVLAGSFGRFGNAIGLGTDRVLMGTPLGQFPAVFGVKPEYVDPETGMSSRGNPMMRSPEDRAQRRVESAVFTPFGLLAMLLVFGGYLIVRQRWPRDKRDRELWDANGWRPGTVALQLGNGEEIPFSTTVGPFAPLRPYLAAAGAMKDVGDRRAKQQAALDEKAARLGLPAGKLPPIGAADLMAVGFETAWAAAMGGRTAAGLIGSITDYGLPNAQKLASGAVSPYVPGLPALQELSRMAGVRLDEKLATVGDFMLPLPTSGAAQVNMLGDRVGGANELQRIVQVLTGGTYPGITDADASRQRAGYAALFATEYRPPAIDPNRGYAFADGFRPMNPQELSRYSLARGQAFKDELQGVDVTGLPEADARKAVQAAYQRANSQALEAVGVTVPASSRAAASRQTVTGPAQLGAFTQPSASVAGVSMPQGVARLPGLRRTGFRVSGRAGRRGSSLRRGRSLSRRLRGPSLRRASVRGIRFPTARRRRGRSIRTIR